MIIPGSCNNGFKSRPSTGKYGNKRSNGLDINKVYSIKPTPKKPSTPSTRARNTQGNDCERIATTAVQPACITNQSKIAPS